MKSNAMKVLVRLSRFSFEMSQDERGCLVDPTQKEITQNSSLKREKV